MSPSTHDPWDAYEDDHTRDPFIITAESGEETRIYYKKTPDLIAHIRMGHDRGPRNLDSVNLKYWTTEIEKRRKHMLNYVDLAASTWQIQPDKASALERACIAVQAVILADTYQQLVEHFEKPAEDEIKRLEESFQQGPRESERVQLWRKVMEGFHVLRDEAQSMAENMEFGAGTQTLL